jgi:diguanylate cyclase (GGDEF)-like protein
MTTKAKILLVQNAQTQGNGTRRHLESVGYDVIWAGSGMSALSVAKHHTADLIIIDVALPDIEGGDLCTRFRSREATRSVPIILLTGRGYAHQHSAGRNGGPDDYLAKPFSAGELAARIAVALTKHQPERQGVNEPAQQTAPDVVPASAPSPAPTAPRAPGGNPGPVAFPAPSPAPQSPNEVIPVVAQSKDPQETKGPSSSPQAGYRRKTDVEPRPAAAREIGDPVPEEEIIDPATGLFSRKQFNAMFSKDFKRSVRFKQQLSCMLIDLDGRKMGRQGDEATLKEIVRLVQHTIREVDTAAWWSGEALIVLLPNTIKNDAVQAAMRVLESVANHPFTWADATRVTMSIGVAGLPDRQIDTEQKLIEAAAAACRRAGEFMKP